MAGRARGGAVQRLRRRQQDPSLGLPPESSITFESKPTALGNKLVDLCCWKYISPQTVQDLALVAMQDVCHVVNSFAPAAMLAEFGADGLAAKLLPGLSRMAKLGNSGKNKNHINRDLEKMMPSNYIPRDSFFLPLYLPGEGILQIEQTAIWPHELFSSMYHHNREAFDLRVCPGPDRLQEFWRSQSRHPNFKVLSHELRRRPGWMKKAVPLKTHGDQVPVTGVAKSWSESQDFVEWVSMVVHTM